MGGARRAALGAALATFGALTVQAALRSPEPPPPIPDVPLVSERTLLAEAVDGDDGIVRPARAVYSDRFYGITLRPPRGWVEHFFSGIYSVGPSEDSLLAYPLQKHFHERMFTVSLLGVSEGSESLDSHTHRMRSGASGGERLRERRTRIAGRPTIAFDATWPADEWRCPGCRRRTYVTEWSRSITVALQIFSAAQAPREHEAAAIAMLHSLGPGPVDPRAAALGGFLDARAAGRGAERWMTPAVAGEYERLGLFAIGEPGEPNHRDLTGFEIEASEPFGTSGTLFDVRVEATQASQRERILIGHPSPGAGRAVVLGVAVLQKAGTS